MSDKYWDEDNPEWTKEEFLKAKRLKDDRPDIVNALKRGPGRPRSEKPKIHIGMRLDDDIVDWLRRKDGYNTFVNATLRGAMENEQRD